MSLTHEQRMAVEAGEGTLVLTAAAGSGKTRVLTQRYLRLVTEGGIPPSQAAAITFTRKSAAELKRRIVAELSAMGLEDLAQQAETGPIQTIDSFCQRLLRENSRAAGVDPEFQTAPEATKQSAADEAVSQGLTRLMARDAAARSELVELSSDIGLTLLLENGGKAMEAVRTADDRAPLWPAAASKEAYERAVGAGLAAASGAEIEPSFASVHEAAAMVHAALQQDRRARGSLSIRRERIIADEKSAELGRLFLAWGLEAADLFEAALDRQGLMDHAMVDSRLIRLLEGSPAAARRLQSQYLAVLVDEAQDINPRQARIIKAIQGASTMLVGDPQQSIYRFRGADREVFVREALESSRLSLSVNFRSRPGIIEFINASFSGIWPTEFAPMAPAGAPLDMDELFGSAMPGGGEGVEIWRCAGSGKGAESACAVAGAAHLALREGVPPGDIVLLTQTHASGDALVAGLRSRGLPVRQSGGKNFYKRMETIDVANALEALSDPRSRTAWLAMLLSPVVGLSLDAVVRLDEQPSLMEALEEPLPDEEDEARRQEAMRWLPELAARSGRLAAWEVLGEIIAQSGFIPRLARQPNGLRRIANIRKLVQVAAAAPDMGPQAFSHSVRMLKVRSNEGDADSRQGDEEAVQVMTIHASKGLEFPVVVLPELSTNPWLKNTLVRSRAGLPLPLCQPPGERALAPDWLGQLEHQADGRERERLIYVAMTRAKERLCLVAPVSSRKAQGPLADRVRALSLSSDAVGALVREFPAAPGSLPE
jgi:ATP-dependent exoDNAse (exonuclease V) beta subunit